MSQDDFMYLPAGVSHWIRNGPVRVMVMAFRLPAETGVPPPLQLLRANAPDVPFQVLGLHGLTSQVKLLMGTTRSKRGKLAAAPPCPPG